MSPRHTARYDTPFGQESILFSCVFNDCFTSFNCVCCSFRALNMPFLKSSISLPCSVGVWFSETWFRLIPCLRMSQNFNYGMNLRLIWAMRLFLILSICWYFRKVFCKVQRIFGILYTKQDVCSFYSSRNALCICLPRLLFWFCTGLIRPAPCSLHLWYCVMSFFLTFPHFSNIALY